MKCPNCQTENPATKKFCRQCGAKLLMVCSQCGSELFADDKFCGECGHDLTALPKSSPQELSFEEKLDKIQRYLPGGITEKILAQRGKIEGERRVVTVMFCDMKGFTPLTERLGPEEVYSLMDKVYEILIHKVHDYEGTVNEMTGDGVMALFGAPIALEDAPQRAIRSALAIHREMARFSEQLQKDGKDIPPLRMRVGIHTGPVVVGTLGNDLRVEFKAVGDTVNLASRMEGLAEPGTTYVTGDTFKLTEGLFRFEGLGKKEVKGKAELIDVYRVIAPSTRRTRFDVSAERGLTPFVGRQRELELLLDAYDRAKEGSGQAYSIIGEAGVGKSRFLYEFRKAVSNENITFLEGKCLSYGKDIAYHPISDILKGNFDIREEDGDERIREKVRRSLRAFQAEETATLPYLLELLSVKDSGIEKIAGSPEGRKDRIIMAVEQLLIKGAAIRPLVIVVEDMHWADKASENALKWLLEVVPGASILIIFTYRPEFFPAWGGRSYHNQITLNRLSNRETLLMVSNLLGTAEVAPELETLLLTKTEGIPFFIEEFVKALQDLPGTGQEDSRTRLPHDLRSLAVPTTIQDVLMARVDRLTDPAKTVLQAGSVIEREFPYNLVRKVTGLPEAELLTHLSTLKEAELLYERGVYPKTSYVFRHALTREVVYSSILTRRRMRMHADTGTAIEELHKDDLTAHCEVLSEHFFQGENYPKAAEYAKRAARKAEKSASLPDAIAHARRRVVCIERLPRTSESERDLIDARTALALYLAQINYVKEAREAVESVVLLAREKGYRKRYGQIQTVMGLYYAAVEENFPAAFETLEEALRIGAEEKDFLTLVLANFWLGWTRVYNCDFERARAAIQRVLDINTVAGNLWGIASAKAFLVYSYCFFAGKLDMQADLSAEALQVAEESGDTFSRAYAFTARGVSLYVSGFLDQAPASLLEGKRLCERIDLNSFASMASVFLGYTYFETGEFEKAREYYDLSWRFLQRIDMLPSWEGWTRLGTARCRAMLGDTNTDLNSLCAIAENWRIRAFEGEVFGWLGQILLNVDDHHTTEAEHWIRKGIEASERNGTRFLLAMNHRHYADFFQCRGDGSKARENLGKAIEVFRECGADGWVKRTEEKLAKL